MARSLAPPTDSVFGVVSDRLAGLVCVVLLLAASGCVEGGIGGGVLCDGTTDAKECHPDVSKNTGNGDAKGGDAPQSPSDATTCTEPGCKADAPCQPKTCKELGAECGKIDDGCGTKLDCGKCQSPKQCGGSGTANKCGKPEKCDGIDNNNNGKRDEGCDVDGDDWCSNKRMVAGAPKACPNGAGDCDDADPKVNPNAMERCTGADSDCDGVIDENCPCDFNGNSTGICAKGMKDQQGNCNKPKAYQSTESTCDGKDNDCDGVTDENCPCDYKGISKGVCKDGGMKDSQGNCSKPAAFVMDEKNSCNQQDDDCDGVVDEGCPCNYMGTPNGVCSGGTKKPSGKCDPPPGYEQTEQSCDGKDNDCDGRADEPNGGVIACTPGDQMKQSCGSCGNKVKTCQPNCTWGTWSGCQSQGVCTPGETDSAPCGNCGTHVRRCTQNCQWGGYGTCTGQGVCSPGQTTTTGCGKCRAKKCKSNCQWSNKCTECSCTGFQTCSRCDSSGRTGYHKVADVCDIGCMPSCAYGDNAVRCEPNCGTSFTMCGSQCPSGYHDVRHTCSISCEPSCAYGDNAVVCQID